MRSFTSSIASRAFALLALSSLASAIVTVRIENRCDEEMTPVATYHNGGFSFVGDPKGKGGRWFYDIPDQLEAGRVYGMPSDGSCPFPDGPGCTLAEYTMKSPTEGWINISTVSGYRDPLTMEWACGGPYTCSSHFCPEAYTPDAPGHNPCVNCIHMCDSDFLNVYFC